MFLLREALVMPIAQPHSLRRVCTCSLRQWRRSWFLPAMGALVLMGCASSRVSSMPKPDGHSFLNNSLNLRKDAPSSQTLPSTTVLQVESVRYPWLPNSLYLLTLGVGVGLGVAIAQGILPYWEKRRTVSSRLRGDDARPETAQTLNSLKTLDHAEAALRQSEERFRQIAETVQEGFFVYEVETEQYSYVNPAYSAIRGASDQSTYVGMAHWLDNIHPEDRPRIEKALQLERQGHNFNEEYRFIRLDGEIRWLQSKAFPILNEAGDVVRIIGTVADITDRKRTEVVLKESEERLQEITQTLDQVSYVISVPTGQYLYISPAYERLWGYSCESLYQDPKSWLKRIHADDLDYVLWGLDQLFTGNQTRLEYRIFSADGEIHWIESQSLVVYDEDGSPLRIVGLADDITARKRLEQSLRSQAEAERLLATITQTIRLSLDLDQILSTTVTEVQRTLNADRALIFRLYPDGSGRVIQEAVIPAYPVTDQMRWENEHFSEDCYEYYRQGRPRIVSNVATDAWPNCLAEFMQSIGVKSKIVAPIVQGHPESSPTIWGLLIVHACAYHREWTDTDADFLQRICNQLAIAIDQANLYQQLQDELAEHKLTEEILREREAMLRAIGDNLPKGFIYQRVHEPGRGFYYSYVSAGIERLLGLKPEEVLADSTITRSVGFEEDLVRADQAALDSLKNLSVVELQMRNRTAQGGIQWSSIRSTPRRLKDGRTVWDGVEVDITELKRIEAALQASEELFRRAFDDSPIGISLVTLSGQFIKANPSYCELLGYTEAELRSLTFEAITHPDDLASDLDGFQKVTSGELRSFQMEKRYITKQGNIVPVLLNTAMIRDEQGNPLYLVGHIQDIRDRIKVEHMKNEFISVVSHELRTPLTSIRGALGLVESGVFDDRPERAKQMLNIALTNCDRLVRLVNDILTLERLQSGKSQLVMELCSVASLMQQSIYCVQAIADQANINLSLQVATVTAWTSPDAIIQTLTNLLSNAIKFSSSGDTVWLSANVCGYQDVMDLKERAVGSTSSLSLNVPHLLFIVKDEGRGIPDDKLTTIFDQFQQVDVSDSRKKGGTGLGLAICKNIVQQHGGYIWVESRLGVGSTFYVALPLINQEHD